MTTLSKFGNKRMDAQESADFLGVSLQTFYRMIRKHRIPHWRIGTRNVRCDRDALEAFIANGGTMSVAA
jgi:excisionase family DNA binding protein